MTTNQSKLCVKGANNIFTCLNSLILSSTWFLFYKANILEGFVGQKTQLILVFGPMMILQLDGVKSQVLHSMSFSSVFSPELFFQMMKMKVFLGLFNCWISPKK
jgi:membrane-associated protease RseP (regulator of RpoE activity)